MRERSAIVTAREGRGLKLWASRSQLAEVVELLVVVADLERAAASPRFAVLVLGGSRSVELVDNRLDHNKH